MRPRRSNGRRPMWLVVRRLTRVAPANYLGAGLLWGLFLFAPIATGLLLKALFDRLSQDELVSVESALWLCAAFVVVEGLRGVMFWLAVGIVPYWSHGSETLLRANALRSILSSRGAASTRLPHSSGEAVARFRDDPSDLTELTDGLVDLVGSLVFTATAVGIMLAIDPLITVVVLIPLAVVLVLNRFLSAVIERIHDRTRRLAAAVTGFIGETFGSVLAIKTTGAEAAVLDRLKQHNDRRRKAEVRDRLAMDMVDTVTGSTVEISVGLVLLLSASAMRSGEFTVGDFALFMTYVGWLTMLPRVLSRMLYMVPQATVATNRLTRLMAEHEGADELSRPTGVWLRHEPPEESTEVATRTDRLESLSVEGLTVRHGESGNGVRDVSLHLPRGSFTVVTGMVAAGKTTLVRGLLGLLPATGTVRWNGEAVDDPGTFLVPDRAAYVGQVPRLFSESLRENIQLGWPAGPDELAAAIRLAALDRDIAEMRDGLDTVVGARGVRLSGGQVQRAGAARALVRSPDLLVVDDMSSALDVETEELLWERLSSAAADGVGPQTLLVVSHRRAALSRADTIVVLEAGEVVGTGTLAELLTDCPAMRRVWDHDSSEVDADTDPVAR
ncbi:ATP-binding cassette subfamily B protein [Stackebrandtia endophytica]|uniref:ATP-binding cassette subfamily B protein n=1 Tax=Stackebrandtia endophytica TaxID=1496996 RepID=A0A543AZ99_9ACTN|nr:ABC transporter ATP-binding protein [Stackebrandtia endophytica]TQL77903.1 ATP-binding cassette subfamily B protein [Stackebrandtia endophytica]